MSSSETYRSITPYLCVFGGFITEMSIGSVQYTFGNILPYIASYLASKHDNTAENYDYYVDMGSWIYVARAVFFALGNILATKLVHWFGGRISILIGDVIISGAVALTYFVSSSLLMMILTYGIIAGIGCGISYIISISIAIKWFPNNQAFVAGIILSGYGLSAVIFNVIITYIINPNNIELNSETGFLNQNEVLNNVPSSFWKLGLIYFAMQIIALLLIKEAPKNYNNKEQIDNQVIDTKTSVVSEISMTDINKTHNEKSQLLIVDSENNENNLNKCLKKYDLMILKELRFWNLWFTTFFSQMTLVFFSSQWKTFTNQQLDINDDVLLSYMGSFSSIANATGRICWGYIRDKTTYIKTLTIMTLVDGTLLATWPFLSDIFKGDVILIIFAYLWLGGIYFFQIGIYNVMVHRIAQIYGVDKVNYYHGLLITNQIPAAIFSALVVSEMRKEIGWTAMSLIMAIFQFIAFSIVISSNRCK